MHMVREQQGYDLTAPADLPAPRRPFTAADLAALFLAAQQVIHGDLDAVVGMWPADAITDELVGLQTAIVDRICLMPLLTASDAIGALDVLKLITADDLPTSRADLTIVSRVREWMAGAGI